MSAKNFEINGTRKRFGSITIRNEVKKAPHCLPQPYTVVQLYDTDVVTLQNVNNIITLNSGGWQTVTTKQAMNHAIRQIYQFPVPFVAQRKGEWFVDLPNAESVPFFDGIMIGGDNVNGYQIMNPVSKRKRA